MHATKKSTLCWLVHPLCDLTLCKPVLVQMVETPQGRGHVATLDFRPLGTSNKRRYDTS